MMTAAVDSIAVPRSVHISRALAGIGLTVAVSIGIWQSGRIPGVFARQAGEILSRARTAAEVREQAKQKLAGARDIVATYEESLETAAKRFGLAAIDRDGLGRVNAYAVELQDAVKIAPARSWVSDHLRITATVGRLTYRHRGARVSARHTIARVENIAKVPVAYHVRLASAEMGHCEARGSIIHNAIVLAVGQSAEIPVCSGSGPIVISRVEVLEVTELGRYLLSQLPARSVGVDVTGSDSHRPESGTSICTSVDRLGLAARIRGGEAAWADVIDFYSRHDCHMYTIPEDYRRVTDPLVALPVVADGLEE